MLVYFDNGKHVFSVIVLDHPKIASFWGQNMYEKPCRNVVVYGI